MLNAAHWIFTGLFDVTYRVRLRDPFTMYKVFRRECIDGLTFSSNRFDFDWELVAKLIRRGHVPVEVPVTYDSRDFESGKKVRLFRDPLTWVVACAQVPGGPDRATASSRRRSGCAASDRQPAGGRRSPGARTESDAMLRSCSPRDGWSVAVVLPRRATRRRAVAAEIAAEHGSADATARRPMFGRASDLERFATDATTVSVLPLAVVANAGVLGPVGPLHIDRPRRRGHSRSRSISSASPTRWPCSAPSWSRRDGGSMITLSGGGVGGPRMATAISAYTSSKAAVVALTETVASELEPHGVRVNAVAPGAIADPVHGPVIGRRPGRRWARAVRADRFASDSSRTRSPTSTLSLRFLVDLGGPFVIGPAAQRPLGRSGDLSVVHRADAGSSLYRLRRDRRRRCSSEIAGGAECASSSPARPGSSGPTCVTPCSPTVTRCVGIDNLSTGRREFLADAVTTHGFELVELDLFDAPDLPEVVAGADAVVHLAANADVRFGWEAPRRDLEQNVIVTHNVLEAARRTGRRAVRVLLDRFGVRRGAGHPHARGLPVPRADLALRRIQAGC